MSTRSLFTSLLFIGLFVLALRPPLDPDMWWHLKTGSYIWQNGIPFHDPSFSFTAANHVWITHEWLTELLMIAVYQLGGLGGLSLVFAAVVAVAFFLLFGASDGRPYVAGVATLWGMAAALPFFGTRPQMINILGGAVVIYIVEQVIHGRLHHRWIWSLPVLILVWVNMHGGFLLGLVIMGVYVAGGLLHRLLGSDTYDRLQPAEWKYLATATAVGVGTSLINPFGVEMLTYAYETTLSSEAMQTFIVEWHSPDFQKPIFWLFGSMLLGSWITMVFSKRPVTFTDLLFLVGTSYAALTSKRNIPIFVIVAVPIVARHLVSIFEGSRWAGLARGEQSNAVSSRLMERVNVALAVIIAGLGSIYVLSELTTYENRVFETLPVDAVSYIALNDVDRIYNEYSWGGYLIWRDIPTFIDGRADLFGDEFFELYMRTYQLESDWQDPLNRHDIQHIFIRADSPLDVLLKSTDSWKPIYRDDIAVIFQRNS